MPVCLDGAPVAASTQLGTTGAYVVELSTVLPGLPADLHSTYTGHPHAETRVVHLLLGPAWHIPHSEVVTPPADVLPVLWARSRCLLDHAQRLQEHLEDLGHTARIDISDAALADLDAVATPTA